MTAIRPDDLRRLRRAEPFQPFRIYTTQGEVFEIREPINILIGETFLSVPVRSDPNDLYGDYAAHLYYDQLLRVEPIGTAPVSSGGGS
jgi:hypothetical protein